MMSNTRYRLHWITAVLEVLKTLKEMMIPLLVLVFANGLNRLDSGLWFVDYASFLIFGLLLIIFFITGIIKWKRFVYWFEDDELRIEYGLFVKKKRYIPFDRIQSLDYTEGILHRIAGLVKVKVETAGSSTAEAEAVLTAISKEKAKQIEEILAEAKTRRRKPSSVESVVLEEDVVPEEARAKKLFSMSIKDLLVLATTSGGVGIILSGIAIFASQFSDIIPYERMYEEIIVFVKFGVFIVALAILFFLLVIWLLSVVMTVVSYFGFTVALQEDDIVITRGLLEKKRTTVPLNRVQGVRVIENPIRQLFGYVTVIIDNAGGGAGEDSKIKLFPLAKKSKAYGPLQELFPDFDFKAPETKLPKRGQHFYYRIDFIWILPIIGVITYFFFPYGLLSLLLVPFVVLYGLWQHRTAAFSVFGNQLTVRFRTFSRQTVYLMKKRIQSMEIKQSYFHRRKDVGTLSSSIKSGVGEYNAQIMHMDIKDAEQILSWYEPSSKSEEGQPQ